jgi:hypothetical protein
MPWDANIMGAMTSTRLLQAGKKKLGAENKQRGMYAMVYPTSMSNDFCLK